MKRSETIRVSSRTKKKLEEIMEENRYGKEMTWNEWQRQKKIVLNPTRTKEFDETDIQILETEVELIEQIASEFIVDPIRLSELYAEQIDTRNPDFSSEGIRSILIGCAKDLIEIGKEEREIARESRESKTE